MVTSRQLPVVCALLMALLVGCHRQDSRKGMIMNAPPAEHASDELETADHVQANRLAQETSPYLLQHAHNPVDWYPWGEEAMAKARLEDKPIFLSIGYSACHWCHVMERESFESEEIADLLNAHFVSVKVDREERPDVDRVYMNAVQLLTGSGGWPLSVFLTPDLKPFYGGTYFPPEDRFGRPGFKRLITQLASMWDERRHDIDATATDLTHSLRDAARGDAPSGVEPTLAQIEQAVKALRSSFDPRWGGFSRAPKFPPAGAIGLLLRYSHHSGDQEALNMALTTLDRMAQGGMYDHLGGGFHRYSVDERWLVPHFEKMLYDNALLSRVYLEALQLTGDRRHADVAVATLDYVLRDLGAENGGFHSSEDADSEGHEGKFYVWSRDEIYASLGKADADVFCDVYNVTARGNFEGVNILHRRRDPEARKSGEPPPTGLAHVERSKEVLLGKRSTRVRPGKDDKILTSWNALMISSLAKGYQALGHQRFRDAAERAGAFILREMLSEEGLLHCHSGGTSKVPAFLDDYAFAANAMIDLYEVTFDAKWLDAARRLTALMEDRFWDGDEGGFFSTEARHTDLLTRDKVFTDGAIASGNAVGGLALLRLAAFTTEERYRETVRALLKAAGTTLQRYPQAALHLLLTLDMFVRPVQEVAIVGGRNSADAHALLRVVQRQFHPNAVVAFLDPGASGAEGASGTVPWLQGKTQVDGVATAYVCENRVCREPVTDPSGLSALLKADVRPTAE